MDFRNLTLVGFLTLVMVAVTSLPAEIRVHGLTSPHTLIWIAALVAFAVCFAFATRGGCPARLQLALIALQTLLALTIVTLQPNGLTAALLVIVSGQLGNVPLPAGLAWIAAQTLVLLVIHGRQGNAISITTAYFAFQLFGLFAVRIAHAEGQMRVDLAAANTELKVTTELLEINSRAEERLRISRDLHDLIGHHLTALSLNLEVASHLSGGPAHEHIEKSKSLAKLLLSDVRAVVGRLREEEPVDLSTALLSLRDVIGRPALHIEVDRVTAANPVVAEVALRTVQEIVTNAVRHSAAKHLWLRMATIDGFLTIDARDDGHGTPAMRYGHGLTGMRERAEALGGTMETRSSSGGGFEVQVRVPLAGGVA